MSARAGRALVTSADNNAAPNVRFIVTGHDIVEERLYFRNPADENPASAMRPARWLFAFPALGFVAGIAALGFGVSAKLPRQLELEKSSERMTPIPSGSAILGDAGVAVGAFEIDAFEVSVSDYAACVRARACNLYTSAAGPLDTIDDRNNLSSLCRGGRYDQSQQAMNCVDWFDASAYCKFVGKRLPTYEEWWLAIGSKHPEHGPELHRVCRVSSQVDWFAAAEWTSSPVSTATELRRLGAWRIKTPDGSLLWTLINTWAYSVLVRSPMIGFRCAR